MSIFARVLTAMVIAAFVVGPISVAAAPNASTVVAQATNATISGTVVDDTGAPVSGARVELRGTTTLSTTTDAQGTFSISNVGAGLYALIASKPGFEVASESDFVVLAGTDQKLSVGLRRASLTSLRTIASVRTIGRSTFNTTTAAVGNVSASTLAAQGAQQLTHVLDQVPGTQISVPGNSVNGASPGGITFAQIRDARSYETATLIDGHPLYVGDYGDYVTTFWTSYMWGNIEVSKGPGAMVPQVNNAITGSVNLRTKDPTFLPTPDFTAGMDNHGGSFLNLGVSDTIANGRLGFVVDVAQLDEPSAYGQYHAYFSNVGGLVYNGVNLFSQGTKTTIPGTISQTATGQAEIGCCVTANGKFTTLNELLKVRYKFSDATTATISYLANQATADQFGNTGDATNTTFTPFAGPANIAYTGPAITGSVPVVFLYPSNNDTETNNEPMFQGELSTTLGNDNIIGRYYHATISRLQSQGSNNPTTPESITYMMSGNQTAFHATPGLVFQGQQYTFQDYDYYRSTENDLLTGYSFEYQHPIGDNLVALSYDTNTGASNVFSYNGASGPGLPAPAITCSGSCIPTGSNQVFRTIQLRGEYHVSPKIFLQGALYSEGYTTTSNSAAHGCNYDGSGACTFVQSTSSHFDGRIAAEWRPDTNWAVRASAGSSIAPPYLGLLTATDTSTVTTNATTTYATVTSKNNNLLPETAMGYDLGADRRLSNDTYLSADLFMNNLFNGYIQQLTPSGLTCATFTCTGPGAHSPNIPIYYQSPINLSNVRFEGFELSIKHSPAVGFGWTLQGSTQRGYAYNIPGSLYCSNPTVACVPANYNQNLNLVNGVNFNGGSTGAYTQIGGGVASTGVSSQNTNVPYLQGNVELRYTFANKIQALFGETLEGKNNSYNNPAFGIAYASLSVPIRENLSFQISGDNIFNAYTNPFPLVGAGVPILLANGSQAATSANVVGPAIYRFALTEKLP